VTFKLTQGLIKPFDRPHIISYLSSIVTMSVSCTVFEKFSLIS